MNKNAVAIFVVSIASLSIWELLYYFHAIDAVKLTALFLISITFFVYASYNLLISYEFTSPYVRYVIFFFLFYEFITVVRGFSFSYDDIKACVQTREVFWPFVIPLFVFFDKKISTLALLMKWIYRIGLFFLLLCLVFPTLLIHRLTAETAIGLATACGFLLLISTYLSSKKVNISFVIIFISLLSVTYLARRNVIITLSGFIVASYLFNVINKSRIWLFKFFPLVIGLILFLFFNLPNYSAILTSRLEERMSDDTRTGLFEMFFVEMRDDMTFGKGMNGTYFYPSGGELEEEGITFAEEDNRNLIENGYLQFVLTGGFVHVVLFLLIAVPALALGIFKSSNQLARAAGIVILLWLLDMLIYGLPRLSLPYILVWISIGICYSTDLRNTSDEEIRDEFQKIGL